MKPLTCEMCGSTDVVREEDLYVCRHCGTKYTPEAARKIMIEGPVDVSGSTVKVDTSQELENLYTLAHMSHGKDNASAAKYYDMIRQKVPNDWEATFYSACCKAASCSAFQAEQAVEELCGRYAIVMELLKKQISDRSLLIETVQKLYDDCYELADGYYYSNGREQLAPEILGRFGDCILCTVFKDEKDFQPLGVQALKKCVEIMRRIMSHDPEYRHAQWLAYDIYTRKIQFYEPSFTTPSTMGMALNRFFTFLFIFSLPIILIYLFLRLF